LHEYYVSTIHVKTQPNQVADGYFQGTVVYAGSNFDSNEIAAKNFEGLDLIGVADGAAYAGEVKTFHLTPPRYLRYVVINRPVNNNLQVCSVEIY